MTVLDPIKILLVEDNPADAELTKDNMEDAKILNTLDVVEDGEEALQYLRKSGKYTEAEAPDLVLLDLNLPRKDGKQVLAEMKEDEALRKIPVVILTSSDAEEDVIRSYDLHASAYVRKPVNLEGYQRIVSAIDAFWLGLVRYPGRDSA